MCECKNFVPQHCCGNLQATMNFIKKGQQTLTLPWRLLPSGCRCGTASDSHWRGSIQALRSHPGQHPRPSPWGRDFPPPRPLEWWRCTSTWRTSGRCRSGPPRWQWRCRCHSGAGCPGPGLLSPADSETGSPCPRAERSTRPCATRCWTCSLHYLLKTSQLYVK